MLELICLNSDSRLTVEAGTTLMDVLSKMEFERPYPILAARVNNRYKPLSYPVYKPVTVEFLDVRSFEGYRVYQRTICFVLQMASTQLFAERKLRVRHTLGSGFQVGKSTHDAGGGSLCAGTQITNFIGNYSKAFAGFSGSCGFDGSV